MKCCHTDSFYSALSERAALQKKQEIVVYLCFLKVWKALSLLKLDRLSVAGWNGTEWMKVETEGESCNMIRRNKNISTKQVVQNIFNFSENY